MIEFLYIFLMFVGIVFLSLQFTQIANAQAMLNLGTYAAARDYAVNYSSGTANVAANTYMAPLLPGVGSGDVYGVYVSLPSDPGFGHQFEAKSRAGFKLMPLPVIREFFGFSGDWAGKIRKTIR